MNQTKNAIKGGLKVEGVWRWEVRSAITGRLMSSGEKRNLVPNIALDALAAQMAGDNINNIGDNLYAAVGDDNTPPAAADTILGNETARKGAGSTAYGGGVASIATFFAAGEATGTHREFGLFGDGLNLTANGGADTGVLFSHIGVNVSVAALETLTLTFEMTFTYTP